MGIGNQLAARGATELIGGAALGTVGGALGCRSSRARQHEQAMAEWARSRHQIETFERSMSLAPDGALAQIFENERRVLRRLFGSEPERQP